MLYIDNKLFKWRKSAYKQKTAACFEFIRIPGNRPKYFQKDKFILSTYFHTHRTKLEMQYIFIFSPESGPKFRSLCFERLLEFCSVSAFIVNVMSDPRFTLVPTPWSGLDVTVSAEEPVHALPTAIDTCKMDISKNITFKHRIWADGTLWNF